MYVCICNQITEDMLQKNLSLANKIGTNCGKCKENFEITDYIKNPPCFRSIEMQAIKYS